MMSKKTDKWVEKIAKQNGVAKAEVLKYLRSLLSPRKVLSHLKLF